MANFHRLPGNTPNIETALSANELITAVTLPPPLGGTHIYQKVRDRSSYAFALISVGAVIQKDGTGRVAVGGVAHKPWRVEAAESVMSKGAKAVTEGILAGATPTHENAFKVTLVERTLASVIARAGAQA
jgi:xanthine dehydrogenase YagS FAD-binding subunit